MLALLTALALSQFCYVTSDRSVCNLTTVKCGAGMTCSVGPNRALSLTSTGGGGITGNTCGAGTYAYEIDALGILTCNTVSLASTATALAANPTDCAAGEYATAIAANGNLTCSTPTGIYTRFITTSVVYTDIATAGTSLQLEVLNNGIPAKARVTRVVADVTEAFDDGAGPIGTTSIGCGPTAGTVTYIATGAINSINVRGDSNLEQGSAVESIPGWSAATDLWCTFSTSGGNLNTLTTGALTIYIEYIQYP